MPEADLTALLLAIATLLIGGGGVSAIVKLVQERKRPELDNRAVEVATAGDSVGMSLELATTAMAQVKEFRCEVDTLRTRVKTAEDTADSAETRAAGAERRAYRAEQAVDAWAQWADNIVRRWAELRLLKDPPALPHVGRTLSQGNHGNEDR